MEFEIVDIQTGVGIEDESNALYSDNHCAHCDAEFASFDDYLYHLSTVHKNQGTITCILCEVKPKSLDEYAYHFVHVHRDSMFPCVNCCRIYSTSKQLWDHQIHHKICGDLTSCSQCPMMFKKKDNLIGHEYTHKIDDKNMLNSNFIPHLSSYLNMQVRDYLTSISASKPFFCIVCKQKHKTIEDYINHLTRHRSSPACHLCGKPYVMRKHLSRHLVQAKCTVKQLEVTKCEKCNELYVTKDKLKHTRECHPPIVCKVCYLQFKTVPDMSAHYTEEHCSQVLLVKCKYCQKHFAGQQGLESHMKRHNIKLYKYNCYLCEDVVFKHPSLLFAHFYSTHPSIKPYTCIICKMDFRSRKSFSIHIKLQHQSKGTLNHNDNFHVTFDDNTKSTKNTLNSGKYTDQDVSSKTIDEEELSIQNAKDNVLLITEKEPITDTIMDAENDTNPKKISAKHDSGEIREESNTIIKTAEKAKISEIQQPILVTNAHEELSQTESDIATNSRLKTLKLAIKDEVSRIATINTGKSVQANNLLPYTAILPAHQPVLIIDGESLSKKNDDNSNRSSNERDDNLIIDDRNEHMYMDEVEYLELSDTEHFEVIKSQINASNIDNKEDDSIAVNSDSSEDNVPLKALKKTSRKKKPKNSKKQRITKAVSLDDEQVQAKSTRKYRKNGKNDSNKFTCPHCGVKCYTFQNFTRHKSLHSRNISKECLKCGKQFRTVVELNEHLSSDHKKSVLTDTLQDIIEKQKIKSKFNIIAIKVDKNDEFPSASITKYVDEPKTELKSFLESFTADIEPMAAKVQIKVVNETQEPTIKTIKLNLNKNDVFTKLAMPEPFKRSKETEVTKVKVALGNLDQPRAKLNFGIDMRMDTQMESSYNDFLDDDNSDVDQLPEEGNKNSTNGLSIPEVGEEVMLTTDETKHKVIKQDTLIIPRKTDVKSLRIGHLTLEAPYYKIVKVEDLITGGENKSKYGKGKKRKPKMKSKLKPPEGHKFVNVNPLEHLLSATKVDKPKRKNQSSEVSKALKLVVQEQLKNKV